MRITKIHLQNIGVFEDATIDFPEKTYPDKAEIHILTGENGTGKSTVLYALANLQEGYKSFNNRSRYRDSRTSTNLYFDDKSSLAYTFNEAGYLTYTWYKEQALSEFIPSVDAYLKNRSNFHNALFDFAFFAYSGYRNLGSAALTGIQEIPTSPFENALNFNNSVNPMLFMQWVANTKTKEALEFLKNGQGNSERYRNAILRIERAIAEIVDRNIEFVIETDPLNVVLEVEGKLFSFDVLPDGLKSIISWMADLLMRMDRIKWATDVEVLDRNFILFLDEIDVHLHPAWQRKVLPAIQKLFKNAQIFVSTHSPFVVGSVDGAWVHKLVLDEKGNSHAKPPKLSEDGESYRYILREVFDIDKDFGPGTEADLEHFKELKKNILLKQPIDKMAFLELARNLAGQSLELSTIIGSELRQLSRITQEEFAI